VKGFEAKEKDFGLMQKNIPQERFESLQKNMPITMGKRYASPM